MGLRTQGKFGIGLADELAALLQKLGETGTSPSKHVPDPRAAATMMPRPQAARSGPHGPARGLVEVGKDARRSLARIGRSTRNGIPTS